MVLKKIENENVPFGAFLGPWRLLGNFLFFCMFCACVEKNKLVATHVARGRAHRQRKGWRCTGPPTVALPRHPRGGTKGGKKTARGAKKYFLQRG